MRSKETRRTHRQCTEGLGTGKAAAGIRKGKAKEEGRTRARGAQSHRDPGAREPEKVEAS